MDLLISTYSTVTVYAAVGCYLCLAAFREAGSEKVPGASMSARVIAVSAFASASEQLIDPVFCPLADLHVENSDSQCCDPSC
jgi:hypothetical protein